MIESGAAAIDFEIHLPKYDLTDGSPLWESLTWHTVRDRILRLANDQEFPYTALGKAVARV